MLKKYIFFCKAGLPSFIIATKCLLILSLYHNYIYELIKYLMFQDRNLEVRLGARELFI